MKTYLSLNTQLRTETDAEVIANLLRKGWVETPPPSYDPDTQHSPEWVNGAWTIRDLTPEEIAAKTRKVWKNAGLFWDEFTPTEQLDIMDSTADEIRLLDRALVVWAGEVWSDDAMVQNGLDALVSNGIISAERKAEILS